MSALLKLTRKLSNSRNNLPLVRGKTFEEHLSAQLPGINKALSADAIRKGYYEWTPKPTDVILCAHPKSGSTWAHYTIHQLLNRGDSPKGPFDDEIGFLGAPLNMKGGDIGCINMAFGAHDVLWPVDRPARSYHSHLQWCTTNKFAKKYVTIARDGRDVLVSAYHFTAQFIDEELWGAWVGEWDDVCDAFLRGFEQPSGDWFYYVHDIYEASKTDPRILFLTYENMRKDTAGTVRQIANHLEMEYSDEEIQHILEKITFEKMKTQESKFDHSSLHIYKTEDPVFFRKGLAGDYRKELWTKEQLERYDERFYEVFGDDHPWK